MRRAVLVALSLMLASLAVGRGCTSAHKTTSPEEASSMLSGDWVLSRIRERDVGALLGEHGRAPTISFGQDGRVSGFSGVNRFSSALDREALGRGGFKLGEVATTRMAGPPEAMNLESDYTSALTQATGFTVDSGTLSLTRGSETLLKFTR